MNMREELKAFVDNELSEERRAEILRALETDADLQAEVIEQVLVKVNGEILTKTDIEQLQVTALRANNPNLNPADLQNDAALRKMLDEVTPRVIVNSISAVRLGPVTNARCARSSRGSSVVSRKLAMVGEIRETSTSAT